MPLRPYSRGLSRFRREPVRGAVAKMGLPWDAYYVLTKAEARLTNSKIHPNSGAPDYDITHLVSGLTGDTDDLTEGTTNLFLTEANLLTFDTDDLPEGAANFYYTDARVDAYGDTQWLKLDGSNANQDIDIGAHDFTLAGVLTNNIGASDPQGLTFVHAYTGTGTPTTADFDIDINTPENSSSMTAVGMNFNAVMNHDLLYGGYGGNSITGMQFNVSSTETMTDSGYGEYFLNSVIGNNFTVLNSPVVDVGDLQEITSKGMHVSVSTVPTLSESVYGGVLRSIGLDLGQVETNPTGTTDAISQEVIGMRMGPFVQCTSEGINSTVYGLQLINLNGVDTTYGVYNTGMSGTTQYFLYNNSTTAHNLMGLDNSKTYFGTGKDISIYFDAADLIINSENVTANDEVHFVGFDAITFGSSNLTTTGIIRGGTAYIGDGGITNYTEIATDGDLTFVGGAGLSHGDIYGIDETVTCTTQNTWYQATFDTAGPSNSTTVSTANNDITIIAPGAYHVGLTVCCHSAVSHDFEVMVKKNNGATDIHSSHLFQTTAVANQVENMAGSCNVSFAHDDTVEVWVRCTDAAAIDFIMDHLDLNIVQIGGT